MNKELEYYFDEVDFCECIGEFEEEYVYDIEIDDDTHTFVANDILVHNSLYLSYENLLKTINNYDNMSQREILDVIVNLNLKYGDKHNEEFISNYYKSRFVTSVHKFELETVALSGLWLNVKKRYCQILLWKDGKYFDDDALPMKVKGLEMTKSSYPKFVRENLKKVVRSILENTTDDNNTLWNRTNILIQQTKQLHRQAPIEDICENKGVNGYTKYIIDKYTYDEEYKKYIESFNLKESLRKSKNPDWKNIKVPPSPNACVIDKTGTLLYTEPKCPANVRGLGNYNTIREAHGLKGDPIYGGKCKIYFYKPTLESESIPFAFQAKNYPKWADEYAPINRDIMFQKYFLDPLNRICTDSMGFDEFTIEGYRQLSLFDF